MDLKKFDALSSDGYKAQTQANWTNAPCGSNYSNHEFGTLAYFEDIEKHRYSSHPWLLNRINSFNLEGKKVLEIGYGMGTDHLSLARRGGIMNGIDITAGNKEITGRRFELYGQKSNLVVDDAEIMPFPDNSFDFVYSFGVIHHAPDTERIVREIHRVLKPGGRCWIAVYNKSSVYFWWSLFLVNYVLKGGFRKRTLQQQVSLLEYPNDNENLVVRLYTPPEFEGLFSGFASRKREIHHLIPDDVKVLQKLYREKEKPRTWLDAIGRRFGWYIAVEAVK